MSNIRAAPAAPVSPQRPRLSIIAALARNRVIGKDNALPWRLPEDLRRFRALTTGHPIVMGRKTHESLARPLPQRRNIVISRNRDFTAAGCEVVPSLDAALQLCAGADDVFIIGGAALFAQALPLAKRLYLTEVHIDAAGDVLFPAFDASQWRETARERHHAEAGFSYDFVDYERVSNDWQAVDKRSEEARLPGTRKRATQ